jgi:N-acyl-D-aspartate/D-glutamate deacylase
MRILIRNGTIIDGTGKPGEKRDVWIENDKIYRIGNFATVRAHAEINAQGLIVAPGFIDALNHSDAYLTLFRYPSQESLLYQGITTIIGGMCGSSLAPLVHANVIASIQKWADVRDFSVDWSRFGELLDLIEKRGLGVNFSSLVGHATLRRGLIGDAFRPLTEDEFKKAEYLLKEALSEGAFGFSSGLAYSHAKVAPRSEIVRFLAIVKKHNGVYASHIRGEGGEILFALEEAIEAARSADVAVEISHLKVMGSQYWKLFPQALKVIENARAEGAKVTFNLYPYLVTGSVLYTLLPDWVAEGGRNKMLERLLDPAIRARAVKDMGAEHSYEYRNITIAVLKGDPTFIGKTIAEIAQNQGALPEETVINILIAAEGRVIAFMAEVSEENVALALAHPASHIASDGAGYTLDHKKTRELVHPRSFGAFPRVIGQYTHSKKSTTKKSGAIALHIEKPGILTLEEAIAKMTSRPAQTFGISGRGEIREGYFADIVIFNPRAFTDTATFTNPYRYAEGVEHLLINGKEVIKKRKYQGVLAGRALRKR